MSDAGPARAEPRKAASARCWVDDRQRVRYARLANLSCQGALVSTAAPPQPGARVRLRFYLREGGPAVCAEARVVWNSVGLDGRGGVMGVHFLDVSDMKEVAIFLLGG